MVSFDSYSLICYITWNVYVCVLCVYTYIYMERDIEYVCIHIHIYIYIMYLLKCVCIYIYTHTPCSNKLQTSRGMRRLWSLLPGPSVRPPLDILAAMG